MLHWPSSPAAIELPPMQRLLKRTVWMRQTKKMEKVKCIIHPKEMQLIVNNMIEIYYICCSFIIYLNIWLCCSVKQRHMIPVLKIVRKCTPSQNYLQPCIQAPKYKHAIEQIKTTNMYYYKWCSFDFNYLFLVWIEYVILVK